MRVSRQVVFQWHPKSDRATKPCYKLDPVPGWTCAQEAFPVVLSLMAYRI